MKPAKVVNIFLKPPTSLLEPDGKIIIPEGAGNVHYEGEWVVVIGRKIKKVSAGDVPKAATLSARVTDGGAVFQKPD